MMGGPVAMQSLPRCDAEPFGLRASPPFDWETRLLSYQLLGTLSDCDAPTSFERAFAQAA